MNTTPKIVALTVHNSVRGVLIDPITKTVVDCRIPADFDRFKADVLRCDLGEVVDLGEGVDAWIDEEGSLKDWDAMGVCRLVGQLTLFGRVALTGRDEANDMADLPNGIDADMVRGMVAWVSPKTVTVPAPTLTTFNNDGQPVVEKMGVDRTYKTQQG